jgi:cyclohexa-1,5-dienecarbonyl-CoA hydratase
MKEIAAQMAIDRENSHKKLIVFGAEGGNFSFGASVEEHTADKIGGMLPYFHSFLGTIITSPIPTLAKVSGRCLGGGFELVLACTFILADETAKFGLPEIRLGVFPPPACVLLPLRAGDALSARMILTGDQFEAKALGENGLLTSLVAQDSLDAAVDDFFRKHLLPKSASSLRIAHRACRGVLADAYAGHIAEAEKIYVNELLKTADAEEGIRAFMEKRTPKWKDA